MVGGRAVRGVVDTPLQHQHPGRGDVVAPRAWMINMIMCVGPVLIGTMVGARVTRNCASVVTVQHRSIRPTATCPPFGIPSVLVQLSYTIMTTAISAFQRTMPHLPGVATTPGRSHGAQVAPQPLTAPGSPPNLGLRRCDRYIVLE